MAGHTTLTDPATKQTIIQLRAQGATYLEIERELKVLQVKQPVSDDTIRTFLLGDEAKPLVSVAAERIRASVAQESQELVPKTFGKLRDALENGAARDADAYARVVVALTRGFVAERVELTPAKQTTEVDELTQLLLTHGVSLPTPAEVRSNLPASDSQVTP